MTPQDMIARYAQAVARRLPKPMREDVRAELQELLMDSLRERAGAGAPTEAMASDLLLSFGAPREVALRYHAPAPIIDPEDTRLFKNVTGAVLGGFALLTISALAAAPRAADLQALGNKMAAGYVWAALQIFGLIVALFWGFGALRRRYPSMSAWKPNKLPRVIDPDHVNRLGYALMVIAGAFGTLSLVNPRWFLDVFFLGHAPAAAVQALAYDPDFMRIRGPWLFSSLGFTLLLFAWVAVEGRWRAATRRAELTMTLVICASMAWSVLAGHIFQSEPADQMVKLAMAILTGFTLASTWSDRDRYKRDGGTFAPRAHPVTNH